jgi:hypothetical protein
VQTLKSQDTLIKIVDAARQQPTPTTREDRASLMCKMFANDFSFHDWIGTVASVSEGTDNNSPLVAVNIGNNTTLTSWTTRLADMKDHTLLDPTSDLGKKVAKLHPGDRVKISGEFIQSEDDCVKDTSLLLGTNFGETTLIVRFTDFKPAGSRI